MLLLLALMGIGDGGKAALSVSPHRAFPPLLQINSVHPDLTQAALLPDCFAPAGTLIPTQIAHAYGYDQFWGQNISGQNMTIYLVELGPVLQSDLSNYFSCIGFDGATHFKTVNVDTPPVVSSASLKAMAEATLDTEMVAGLAQSSTIVDVQTDGNAPGDIWQHLNDELQQISAETRAQPPGQSMVSISLGTPETTISSTDRLAIDQSLAALAQRKFSIFVASGDSGGQVPATFPASDPWVTAVGGTELSVDAQGNRLTEVGWPRSGGGVSQFFARPGFEQARNMNPAIQMRQIPDVSAVATRLPLYFNGRWTVVEGTSASAPIWATGAALLTEALQQQEVAPPSFPQALYAAAGTSATPLTDITLGNNGFAAAPGWDDVSGLGTPNLPALLQVLRAGAFQLQG